MKLNVKVSRTFNRAALKVKKHSPEILMVAGIGLGIMGTVKACQATTKLDAILDNAKFEIDAVNDAKEKGEVAIPDLETGEVVIEEYTPEEHKKDLAIVYARTGVKLFKLYGPAVLLGATSIACILASNNIIRGRNVALAAAYNVVDSSFKEYRGRVVERFGKELDRELKFGVKSEQIEETVVNEKGKEKKVKKNIQVVDPNTRSDYARFFDDGCKGWDKDAELNLCTLKAVQNYCNELLNSRGHLFLNEVYDELGIPRTKAGQHVGWVADNPYGDGFVDFGIYDQEDVKKRDFVNGYERVILLDFNVDGIIDDLI